MTDDKIFLNKLREVVDIGWREGEDYFTATLFRPVRISRALVENMTLDAIRLYVGHELIRARDFMTDEFNRKIEFLIGRKQ